jgi:hypothetical protein
MSVIAQGAQGPRDHEVLEIATESQAETDRQPIWLTTRMKGRGSAGAHRLALIYVSAWADVSPPEMRAPRQVQDHMDAGPRVV